MPSEARPAATVLLLRDVSDVLEVFMIERHRNIQFMGGALVFPGGRVNPEDAELIQDDKAEIFPDFAFRASRSARGLGRRVWQHPGPQKYESK